MPGIKKYPAWEELTFANNFLFCKIMEENPEICRRLLEILLHIKIEKLSPPKSEWTMQESVGSKGVRFDIYTKDDKRVFDIEVQTTSKKNLPKRSRYYQSVIDLDNLSHGEKYSQLKDTYVIFLCLSDPFSENLSVYFFENICRTDNKIKLNDGTYKVFFNASEYAKMENDEERNFFKFLAGHKAENALTKSIEEKVIIARKNMEWKKLYMTWQQTIDEEKDIAFEEGAQTRAIESAHRFLAMNVLSYEQIAQGTGLSLEEVQNLAKELQESAPHS